MVDEQEFIKFKDEYFKEKNITEDQLINDIAETYVNDGITDIKDTALLFAKLDTDAMLEVFLTLQKANKSNEQEEILNTEESADSQEIVTELEELQEETTATEEIPAITDEIE